MVKVRNIVYDKELLQQVVSKETTIWATREGTAVLKHLNFFNKVISELLAVDVKIYKENKALIFLGSLLESYNHIVTTMLCDKKTPLILEEVTSILLSNEIKKRPNQVEQEGSNLVRKGREEKKSLSSSKALSLL